MILNPVDPDSWPDPKTPYEAAALTFCIDWLGGQNVFILHTSGSTGTPKPIRLTRSQMQASAQLTGQTLGLQAGDSALVCLNIRYVAGVMMLVRGLELGLPMTIIEPVSNPFAQFNADSTQFAFTAFVPLQLQTILESSPDKLPILNRMKAILVGGAATSPALEQALQVITAPVYATYGMTETVSHIALRRLNGITKTDSFSALNGVQLSTDDRGCLRIVSAATNFEPIQTNDVVDLQDNTHFRLLGRADNIINTGGVKVQPEPVEELINNTLSSYGFTYRVLIVGLADEQFGQRVVAFVEMPDSATDDHFSIAWQAVQKTIRERIGPYAVPKDVFIVPTFVETATGKIDRRATATDYGSASRLPIS